MTTIRLIQADCREWLPQRANTHPSSFHCIFTDFPYWTLNKWAGVGTTGRMGLGRKGSGADNREKKFYDVIDAEELFECMKALDRLLRPNSHLYMMCDDEVSDSIKAVYRTGTLALNYCKRIVWDKVDRGMGYHYRGTYEHIMALTRDKLIDELTTLAETAGENEDWSQVSHFMFLEKGKRRLNDLSLPDVVHFKRVQGRTVPEGVAWEKGDPKHYPTEKPYALVEQFILNSTAENDWVLDPTMGSGVVAEVCLRNNRNFVGVDKSDFSMQWVSARIKAVLEETQSGADILMG